jgi:crotonobetainyl-CoA:carnitine CoA-transferase CaiB-like acyl-CoA transferase
MTNREGALSGLRVIDLTRVLAGPFCTMMLADMGAEVIKVEEPGKGDDSRHFAPFRNGESAYYMNLNRNKKGVTLNLKKGRDIFIELVKTADVLVENYRPGTMDRLGLGYETLKKINPRLVYGAVSGFGDTGPYRLRPGYDIIGQAMGGLMSTTGWPDFPSPSVSWRLSAIAIKPDAGRRWTSHWSTPSWPASKSLRRSI